MLDTMTMTKIIGGFCGTLLVFLFGNWAAETLYHVGDSGHGGEHSQAYVIETDDAHGETEEVVELAFADILAGADAGKGAKVFKKCAACHKVDAGANGTGPTLFGIVGRDIGAEAGFKYSEVLGELPGGWTPDALNEFLTNPKAYAEGTKMTFKGIKKVEDRANLVAYLSSIGG